MPVYTAIKGRYGFLGCFHKLSLKAFSSGFYWLSCPIWNVFTKVITHLAFFTILHSFTVCGSNVGGKQAQFFHSLLPATPFMKVICAIIFFVGKRHQGYFTTQKLSSWNKKKQGSKLVCYFYTHDDDDDLFAWSWLMARDPSMPVYIFHKEVLSSSSQEKKWVELKAGGKKPPCFY